MERRGFQSAVAPAILLLSFLLHIALLYQLSGTPHETFFRHNPAFDSSRFINDAQLISDKGFYTSTDERRLPPLYPLLISALGEDGYGLPIFQSILNIASLAMIYRLALIYFGWRGAIIALTLGALYGPLYLYGMTTLRASVITFQSLLVVMLLTINGNRRIYAGIAGFVMGLLMLTRPYPLSLAALFIYFVYSAVRNKKSISRSATFAILFAMVYILLWRPGGTGSGELSSVQKSGITGHFLSGNVLDNNYGYSWHTSPEKERLYKASEGSPLKAVGVVAGEIAKRPADYAKLYTKKLRMFFGSYEIPSNYNYYLYREHIGPALKIPFVRFGWIVPFALLGIWVSFGAQGASNREMFILPLAWFTALFLGIFIFIIQSRYRLPIVPLFLIFAGGGIDAALKIIAERNRVKGVFLATFLALAFYFCRFDYAPLPAPITGIDYRNLAMAYAQSGDESKSRFFLAKSQNHLAK